MSRSPGEHAEVVRDALIQWGTHSGQYGRREECLDALAALVAVAEDATRPGFTLDEMQYVREAGRQAEADRDRLRERVAELEQVLGRIAGYTIPAFRVAEVARAALSGGTADAAPQGREQPEETGDDSFRPPGGGFQRDCSGRPHRRGSRGQHRGDDMSVKRAQTPTDIEWERAVLRSRDRGTSPGIELLRELVALRVEFGRFAALPVSGQGSTEETA